VTSNSQENKKRTLALVFTQGVGLRSWLRAGYDTREIDYYRGLASKLGGVTFLTYDKSAPRNIPDLSDLGPINVEYNNFSLDRRFFSLLAPILKFRALRNIDVIKTTQHRGSWTALLLKWVLRKPMVARCGYVWSLFEQRSGASRSRMRLVKFLEGFVLKRADVIVVPDRFAVEYLTAFHGISESKFTILPNFVDVDQFTPTDISKRINNQFLFVGRLENVQKRPDLAVGAAALVPEATLDIVGEGPEYERLKVVVADTPNTRLLGRLSHSDVSKLMSSAVGFVIPSSYEGNPKVVIEALSAGLPVIATKSQGLTEIIEDEVNGLLVDDNETSIAAAMRRLIAEPDLWLKLSEGARRTAVENYSRESVMEREVSLLRRLTDR
jgi:glycosyltransferase involved in cell wall biosynthesis